jgi:Flp pilus assembly protein CpaB
VKIIDRILITLPLPTGSFLQHWWDMSKNVIMILVTLTFLMGLLVVLDAAQTKSRMTTGTDATQAPSAGDRSCPKVRPRTVVVFATKNISTTEDVPDDSLEERWLDATTTPPDSIPSRTLVAGRRLRTSVNKGEMVLQENLAPPALQEEKVRRRWNL